MTHRQLSFALLMAGALLLPACKREASPAGPAVPRDETADHCRHPMRQAASMSRSAAVS